MSSANEALTSVDELAEGKKIDFELFGIQTAALFEILFRCYNDCNSDFCYSNLLENLLTCEANLLEILVFTGCFR